MKLLSVGAALPSLEVGNAERVARLGAANLSHDEKARRGMMRAANALLALSGARVRRECAAHENALTLGVAAGEQALARAGIDPATVDGVIYASVSRGYLEPANAAIFAATLGARQAVCFDVSEACMGWLRAVQLASHLLEAGTWRRALIVNVEVHAQHARLSLKNIDEELPYTLPQLTIGEAATVTVLETGGSPWSFWFRSAPAGHVLCKLPLPEHTGFMIPGADALEPYRFYCQFMEMNKFTFEHFEGEYLRFLEGEVRAKGLPVDCVLTHASEYTGWQRWAERCGLQRAFYSIYPDFGNVVSASIPLGIHQARDSGRLQPGNGVYLYVASSGMGVGGAYFQYEGA